MTIMIGNEDDEKTGSGGFASPPCLAQEIDPSYFDPLAVDPKQARDVARWRRARRDELRARRKELSVAEHKSVSDRLMKQLESVLRNGTDCAVGKILSAYWPIKGEPDLRPLLTTLHNAGVVIALPLVETKSAPLVFRIWTPETRMVRGDWNIPVPPADAERVVPDISLAPLVGWDDQCYRLGYGGGYFDRTLAVIAPSPVKIGVGFAAAKLATIYPQPHDIAMDVIVTETDILHADDTR